MLFFISVETTSSKNHSQEIILKRCWFNFDKKNLKDPGIAMPLFSGINTLILMVMVGLFLHMEQGYCYSYGTYTGVKSRLVSKAPHINYQVKGNEKCLYEKSLNLLRR